LCISSTTCHDADVTLGGHSRTNVPVDQFEIVGRDTCHSSGHLEQASPDIEAGVSHRLALDERCATARCRAGVGSAPRVGVHDANSADRHAELGADNLREERLDALAEIAHAGEERRRAVFGDLRRGRRRCLVD
jgi:hypothetical protein